MGPVVNYVDNVTITPHFGEYDFTGKKISQDTGLVYFGGRWYDPEVGRFTSVDSAKDGMNWYEYCRDNPLNAIDPNGLATKTLAYFHYTHTFTQNEATQQFWGNIMGGIMNFLPNLAHDLSGLLTINTLGNTLKSQNDPSLYDQMMGPLGDNLQASTNTTFDQSTNIVGNYNDNSVLIGINVTTSYSYTNNSDDYNSNISGKFSFNFTLGSSGWSYNKGNQNISYPSPNALINDVADAYNNPTYDNQAYDSTYSFDVSYSPYSYSVDGW